MINDEDVPPQRCMVRDAVLFLGLPVCTVSSAMLLVLSYKDTGANVRSNMDYGN
jgi:hypothetical protein